MNSIDELLSSLETEIEIKDSIADYIESILNNEKIASWTENSNEQGIMFDYKGKKYHIMYRFEDLYNYVIANYQSNTIIPNKVDDFLVKQLRKSLAKMDIEE